jgi:hypothetical protein
VCNFLIQVLITKVLSIEERVFHVEHLFLEANRYTDLVQKQFAEKFTEISAPHRDTFRRLIEKFHKTGSVLDAVDIISNTFC